MTPPPLKVEELGMTPGVSDCCSRYRRAVAMELELTRL
jgi:hypothetical protein